MYVYIYIYVCYLFSNEVVSPKSPKKYCTARSRQWNQHPGGESHASQLPSFEEMTVEPQLGSSQRWDEIHWSCPWLTLIALDGPWDFDYLEGCFSNIQHWNSFWPAIGPWSESGAAWHGIEAAIASPNVSNGSGKGVRMGSILIQFPVISSPKLLEDRDVIIIYCHYHSIFIMIYYDLLWSIDLYIYIIFKLFNMVDLWYLCWFKDMSWSSHQVLDASSC